MVSHPVTNRTLEGDCLYGSPFFVMSEFFCIFIVESDVNILMVDTGQKVASNWNPTEHDIMSNDWEIAG